MFLLGLVVGPAIGLVGGDVLLRPDGSAARIGLAALGLVLLVVLLVPYVNLELRLGLVAGVLLGLMLAATPVSWSGSGRLE